MNILQAINFIFILYQSGPGLPGGIGGDPGDPEIDAVPIDNHIVIGVIVAIFLGFYIYKTAFKKLEKQ